MAPLMERIFERCTRGSVNILRLPQVGQVEVDDGAAAEFDALVELTSECLQCPR
jgi:hypothetical protein